MSMNFGVREGRLANDPVHRTFGEGKSVCTFSLAINRKDKPATFINCEAWDKTADTIVKYFAKGDPIIIEESVKQEEWQDKETGQKRTKLVFQVQRFHFVANYDYQGKGWFGAGSKATKVTQPDNSPADGGETTSGEEDIPF